MGIKGLLPVLKPVEKAIVINEYAGQCVAVDGYGWLYRGAYGCAYDLAQGLQTTSYVKFFMHLVKMLLYNNVTPIIVFDGQRLPIKKPVHDLRKKNRKDNYEKGVQFHEAKKNSQAEKYFRHAINITPEMVDKVIEALDEINVRHIVAPFEADSQMTYMFQKNQVQAVITEDSDLLVFGCSKVFYKLDRYGEGRQIVYDDIFQQSELGMGTFNREMFRYMCILAGCDYISSITDGNLKNARFIARKSRTFNGVKKKKKIHMFISDAYLKKFSKANAAFLYQFVFDIETQTYVRLNPLPEDIKVDDLVGLGDSPQNHDIPILQSNKARYIDPKLCNHLEKDASIYSICFFF
ncbi:PIN domain-like protein [Mucor mucedo]|uniref:PIN domain-like protein n=1 Tax=Mucor mucedo TaxID=29922 RepID=UPI002220E9FF|nr:PIN domain-like protein [Mucor mucedo]KAI7888797.1 PIN domain-like protein [Mucor mucedo]